MFKQTPAFWRTRELDFVFETNLNKVRMESIEVAEALRMITATAQGILLVPMIDNVPTILSSDDKFFYHDILAPYCHEIIRDLVCHGYAVSHIQDGIPVRINPIHAIVTIHGGLKQTCTAVFRDDQSIVLNVIVSDMPDIMSGRSIGALSRVHSEYVAARIIWCNELAIGSSNAQTIYTMSRTDTIKESVVMKAINNENHNAYGGGNGVNLNSRTAKQYDAARGEVVKHSLIYDDTMCDDLTDRGRKRTSSGLSVSHPGIQTQINAVYSHAAPAVFLPVPAGYHATYKQPTPEMRTMTTLLEQISRTILQAFGVSASRSVSTLRNGSLYHSKAQMDSEENTLKDSVTRYYHVLRIQLADLHNTRFVRSNKKKARSVFDESLLEPDVAVKSALKAINQDIPILGVMFIPKWEQLSMMYNSGLIKWSAMQKHLSINEGVDIHDLVDADPRLTASLSIEKHPDNPKKVPSTGIEPVTL